MIIQILTTNMILGIAMITNVLKMQMTEVLPGNAIVSRHISF